MSLDFLIVYQIQYMHELSYCSFAQLSSGAMSSMVIIDRVQKPDHSISKHQLPQNPAFKGTIDVPPQKSEGNDHW